MQLIGPVDVTLQSLVFSRQLRTGINIDEGDRLLAVRETDGKKDILLATKKGFAIRFPESDVRPTGRV